MSAEARITMIAMTTNNSMIVNARNGNLETVFITRLSWNSGCGS